MIIKFFIKIFYSYIYTINLNYRKNSMITAKTYLIKSKQKNCLFECKFMHQNFVLLLKGFGFHSNHLWPIVVN